MERGDRHEPDVRHDPFEVVVAGKPALIAQAIRRGDANVALRDDAGIPLWSRARRR
jgi:hypothetical protein